MTSKNQYILLLLAVTGLLNEFFYTFLHKYVRKLIVLLNGKNEHDIFQLLNFW